MQVSRWAEEDLVMISALEHYAYCPRQCALIHVEQVYEENIFTLRGRLLHETVHTAGSGMQEGVRVERALPLWSERLGLVGCADMVEFHPDGSVRPVEYKRGPRRSRVHDDLQVCAQAICLEEMLGKAVRLGAVFYHASRRRREVRFGEDLRKRVEQAAEAVREMVRSQALPQAVNDARCRNCSLNKACMPELREEKRLKLFSANLFSVEDEDKE